MKINQKNIRRRVFSTNMLLSLSVIILLGCSQNVLAQWTTPDGQGNINNTNTGKVGIGTAVPTADLHVASESAAVARGITNSQHSNNVNGGMFKFWKSRGTKASPTSVVDGDSIGMIYAEGYDGTSYVSSARIKFLIDGLVSSGVAPTGVQFFSGTNGGGTERMRITSTGNIGIGTAAPDAKFQVKSGVTSIGEGLFKLQNSGGSTLISMGDDGLATYRGQLSIYGQQSGANYERLRIWHTGDNNDAIVFASEAGGTGTQRNIRFSAPTTMYSGILNARAAQVTSATGAANYISFWETNVAFNGAIGFAAGSQNMLFQTGGSGVLNGTTRMTILANGNVGIGATAPGYKLDLQGGQINSSGGLCIAGECKTAWSQVGGSQWTTAGSNVHYGTGNVGIGTSTPSYRLDVVSGSQWAARFKKTDATNGGILIDSATGYNPNVALSVNGVIKWYMNSNVSSGDALQFWESTGTNPRLTIAQAGNVGIGNVAPGSKLFVGSGTPAGGTLPGLNVALGGSSYVAASNGTINTFIGSDVSSYGIVGTLSNHALGLRANNVLAMTVLPSGNVGIGITTPSTKLHVVGDITVTGNINAKYQDLAEWVPATHALPAGTVAVLNPNHSNQVMASSQAYDTRVAGVISAQPGIVLGEAGKNKVLVATTGRVRVKVDATRAPICIGDLLVVSDTEGMAMKSQPILVGGVEMHRPGTLIGKALEPLAKGTGEILVLLSLQ